jgi:hypothetical protein
MGVMIRRPHPRYLHFVRQHRTEVTEIESVYDPTAD